MSRATVTIGQEYVGDGDDDGDDDDDDDDDKTDADCVCSLGHSILLNKRKVITRHTCCVIIGTVAD